MNNFERSVKYQPVYTKLLLILIVVVIASLLLKITEKILKKSLALNIKTTIAKSKFTTINHTIFYTIKFIVYFVSTMIILDMFGINTASMLATAGIGGIAIAFGCQSIVSDIIRGAFILIDDQLNIGDYVTIDSVSGTVEEIGLRITKIRDYDGSLYIIPNSKVNVVKNATRGNQKADVVFNVSFDVKLKQIYEIINEINFELKNEIDFIEPVSFLGIDKMGEFSYTVKLTSTVRQNEQWKTQRLIRKTLKEIMEEKNIKTTILVKDEKI